MLDRYVAQGHFDALARFKIANQLPLPGMGAAPAAGAGLMDRAKAFGSGQLEAGKSLLGNLHQGLGGAPDAAAGAAARAGALGNLKTLAPSLLAGGGLYMLHRHNQAKREEQARQHAMMNAGGGYPMM
jgi:hypothetical protein